MKRMFGLLLSVLILGQVSSADILTNGGFEPGPGDPSAQWWNNQGWTWSNSGWSGWNAAKIDGAALAGDFGAVLLGWQDYGNSVWCDPVPTTWTGSYTFSAWVLMETNYNENRTAFDLKIEFRSSPSTIINTVVSNYLRLPRDGRWHQIYVTGKPANASVQYANVVVQSGWTINGGGSVYVDDCELYYGSYTGGARVLSNGSFEDGNAAGGCAGTKWSSLPAGFSRGDYEDARSGDFAALTWGGTNGYYCSRLSQPVYAGTGTYTFSAWILRETDCHLTNAELRIEWYDASFSNKVQADTVATLTISNDWTWREYAVSGTCANGNLYEIRPVLVAGWIGHTNENFMTELRVDDLRFRRGTGPFFVTDWAYHGDSLSAERVPGTNNFGAFVQPNYATTTTTFYVMANHPSVAGFAEDNGSLGIRIAWYDTNIADFVITDTNLSLAGTEELSASCAFHGLPAGGIQTVDVWRCAWRQPHDVNGLVTRPVEVYYAPYLQWSNSTDGASDRLYLVRRDGSLTNNLGQLLDPAYADHDYTYLNERPAIWAAFSNGNFETPPTSTDDFVNTGWTGHGYYAPSNWSCAGRDTWAAYAGDRGAYFNSPSNGAGELYQAVEAGNGTRTFGLWVQRQEGFPDTATQLRLEWYDTNFALVRLDSKDLAALPRDNQWHHVYVSGACTDEVMYVRPRITTAYGTAPSNVPASFLLDEASLHSGSWTSAQPELVNGGFEDGHLDWKGDGVWDGSRWTANTGTFFRGSYRAFNGSWCAHLWAGSSRPGFESRLSQAVYPGPGTYRFGAWIRREGNFNLTNAELRIEWYDITLTNKVQADTVTVISPPTDWWWHEYAVTGTCANPALYEVRPVLFVQTGDGDAGTVGVEMQVDDATFAAEGATDPDSDGDGIPDEWERRHFPDLQTSGIGSNSDHDAATDFEEYIADTDPASGSSWFPSEVTNLAGTVAFEFVVGPPTTNSRVYDVWSKADLLDATHWAPYNLDVPGRDDGSALILRVTNTEAGCFYRTGVKLP